MLHCISRLGKPPRRVRLYRERGGPWRDEAVAVLVCALPTILEQPKNAVVFPGKNATLQITEAEKSAAQAGASWAGWGPWLIVAAIVVVIVVILNDEARFGIRIALVRIGGGNTKP